MNLRVGDVMILCKPVFIKPNELYSPVISIFICNEVWAHMDIMLNVFIYHLLH